MSTLIATCSKHEPTLLARHRNIVVWMKLGRWGNPCLLHVLKLASYCNWVARVVAIRLLGKTHARLVHFKANLRLVLVGSIYEFGGLNQCDMAPGEITNGRRARRAHQHPETQSGRWGRQTSGDGGRPRNEALPAKNRETILANRASGASGASNFRHCDAVRPHGAHPRNR